jgi:hypothetical protein
VASIVRSEHFELFAAPALPGGRKAGAVKLARSFRQRQNCENRLANG